MSDSRKSSRTHRKKPQVNRPPRQSNSNEESKNNASAVNTLSAIRDAIFKGNHVMSYLVILFATSFLLMLLSYFIQQRNSETAINTLQFSMSSLQSVDDLIQANETLNEELGKLQNELSQLVQSEISLKSETVIQSEQIIALDWLWRIQRTYSRGQYTDCTALIEAFQATGLHTALPTTSPSGADGSTPAQQYTALLDAMNYLDEA